MAPKAKAALKPWVDRISTGTQPFFLPRVHPDSKVTTWYAFCSDTRSARGLKELLISFVGPTYSQFNGQLASLDSSDPVESACQKEFGNLVFKLPVVNDKHRPIVAKKLELLTSFNDRTPVRNVATQKPIGRLLRDLEMAIVVKNEQSAWVLYEEIRSRGRLSSSNLSFLQVTIYAAFERWQDILSLQQLDDLLRVVRPKRVTEAISTAIYQIHLQSYEPSNDAEGVLGQYKELNGKYDSIFRTTSGLVHPASLKAALIAAVAGSPPRIEQAKMIASQPSLTGFKAWCEATIAAMPVTFRVKIKFGYRSETTKVRLKNLQRDLIFQSKSTCRQLGGIRERGSKADDRSSEF